MLKAMYVLEAKKLALLSPSDRGDYDHPVFGEGNDSSPIIMFIGEAPGREEAACGRPFVGKAGKQLDEMLSLAKIDRSSVYVTNAVKFRPTNVKNGRASNRTPSEQEVRDGLLLLREEIEHVDPSVIATLGNVPLSAALMLAVNFYRKQTVGEVHGMPTTYFIGNKARTVFPLYHPAASIYNRALKPVLEEDLIRLGEFCRSIEY